MSARRETKPHAATFIACAVALAAGAACAPTYDYAFAVAKPQGNAGPPGAQDVVATADLEAEVHVDPAAAAIELDVMNKTDEVVQVGWDRIALTRPDGHVTLLHPDVDLGWIAPGKTAAARLLPIALPRKGDPAAKNQGARWQLDIPVLVRREPRTVHVTLVASLTKR